MRRPVVRSGRPVWRPLRVVTAVVVRWLLRGPGQRVSARRPVLVVQLLLVAGRWRRAAVHVTAAAVGRCGRGRGRPVQRPRFRVMVTTAVVRHQLCGQWYGGRVAQRARRLFLVSVVLIESVVGVRSAAASGRIILPSGIHAAVILRNRKNKNNY